VLGEFGPGRVEDRLLQDRPAAPCADLYHDAIIPYP
jgi:hypothetical protein